MVHSQAPSTPVKSAFFVIADISGYTGFVSGVELDHAHDIISDLMNTLVRALRPPLRLAKFEGDAAFVYAVSDKVDGGVLQDAIDGAYFAFRRRLRDIRHSTTCSCKACQHTQRLDLKFVCHHGEFVEHTMAGRKELAGKDVIVVHRFLKNEVVSRLGLPAYALYSDACVRAMGVDPEAQHLLPHAESIDIIGDVTCWVRDLHAAWAAETEAATSRVDRDDALLVIEHDFTAPRATVWQHITVPKLRQLYQHTDGVTEMPARGRRGAGTTNHCAHGKDTVIEEVLDWRPYEYLTLTTLLPIPGCPKIPMTYAFDERPDGGTHLELRIARPKPKDAPILQAVAPKAQAKFSHEFEALGELLRTPTGTPALVDEPELRPARSGPAPARG